MAALDVPAASCAAISDRRHGWILSYLPAAFSGAESVVAAGGMIARGNRPVMK